MIIFDGSQLLISNLVNEDFTGNYDISLARHFVLNSLRKWVLKFKKTYGPEVVIACDDRKYWRTGVFMFYKAKRGDKKKASKIDWDALYKYADVVKDELKLYSPYKVLEVGGCEGDDIIGVLAKKYHPHEKILILSTDKDFGQLQKYPNVYQYSTIKKKAITIDNPEKHLKELIIRGDVDDGIPNIMSPDNSLAEGIRQKSIYTEKLENWLNQSPEEFCTEDMLRNYHRNKSLIDFDEIPKAVVEQILSTYDNTTVKTKSEFLTYMVENRMKQLIECIGDF